MPKITAHKGDMIRLLRLKGVSFAQIGRQVGMTRGTVQRFCYEQEIVPQIGDGRTFRASAPVTRGEAFTSQEDETLLGLAGLGTMTWAEIGRHMSRSSASCEARVRSLMFAAAKDERIGAGKAKLRQTWRDVHLKPKE